ncbi:MAG: CotH kinase family protein [Eubacteriales bacterium]|nr:CotH kinase family protein [Eubacteriales bacterium]
MKRLRFCFAVLTLALGVLLFSAASAERVTDLWATGLSGSFTPLSTASGDAIDTVHWWKNENNGSYHLFLPGTADLTQARLCFAGGETLTDESGAVIENGGPLSALPLEQPVRLTCGKQTFTLTVWQGSADMPAMYLTTASGSLDFIHKRKTNEETGTLLAKTADGETLYEGELKQIRGRGNASFQFYKKGYQIKLAESTSLYGMSKDRTWELLADYRDNSLLRNSLTLAMADAAGIPYVMDCLHVHLYINGEYMGVYLLSEKVEVDGGRVEIDELEEETEALNDQPLESYDRVGTRKYTKGTFKAKDIPGDPADLTGGYLLMLEYKQRYNSEPSGVVTRGGQAVVLKSPKYQRGAGAIRAVCGAEL